MKMSEKKIKAIVREEIKNVLNESRTKKRLNEDKTDKVVKALSGEFKKFAKKVEDELEDASEEATRKNEAGVLTTVSLAAAVPGILKMISRIGKKAGKYVRKVLGKPPNDESEYQQWMERLGELADELHHHYMKPIEGAVKKVVDDEEKAHKISKHLFHVVIAVLLVASGATAFKAFSADKLSMGTLESALTAIKSDELYNYVSQIFGGN